MPRLFTALEIPGDIALSLGLLRSPLSGARWVEPENYHITLRFIGDVDGRCADDVVAALDKVVRQPFDVRLSGFGAFGTRKPHSVWAAVEPSQALRDLHAEQESRLRRIGLVPEGRKFTPHVTLARLKGTGPGELAGWLAQRAAFRAGPFRADRFVLMSARASRGGGPYVVEEAYALRQRLAESYG